MVRPRFGGAIHMITTTDDPGRIHYGAEEVTGHIILRYLPQTRGREAELVGPLDLKVILQGQIKALHHSSSHREIVVNLFHKSATVHEGPFRAVANLEYRFPFAIPFPELTDRRESPVMDNIRRSSDGTWRYDRHTDVATAEALPPTISSRISKATDQLPGMMGPGASSPFNLDVSYLVSADAQISGIDCIIPVPPLKVLYELPKIPLATITALSSKVGVEMRVDAQDRSLVPEHARPQGFKGKTKALISPDATPRYVFSLGLGNIPQHMFVHQQISFDMYINGRPENVSVVVAPEINLKSCTVSLISSTMGKNQAVSNGISANFYMLMTQKATFTPSGPFSKAHEYRKRVTAGTLGHVPSSFTHAGYSRSYKLRITIQLAVAQQIVNLRRDFDIEIHPPVLQNGEPSNVNGPSNLQLEIFASDELPPTYEEAVAGPSNSQGMHMNYEDIQPSYEEVMAGPSNSQDIRPSYEEVVAGPSNAQLNGDEGLGESDIVGNDSQATSRGQNRT